MSINYRTSYNLAEDFIKSVENFRDRIAIEGRVADGWEGLTYGELNERVKKLAFLLSSRGVKKSDRALVILENRPEWAVIFFTLSYIGAVAVPLDSQLPKKDFENIVSDSGARFAFISKENQRVREYLKESKGIEKVIIIGLEKEEGKFIPFLPEGLVVPEGFKRTDITPEDIMVILYTSGTTDIPKGVMLTHKNLCANLDSLKRLHLFSHRDIVLSILPLYHSYPLMTTLIVPILSGGKIIYAPSDWPEKLVGYLKERRVTVFIGVPQIFHMMHGRMMKRLKELPLLPKLYLKIAMSLGLVRILLPGLRNAFGRPLRFFACGGAKLDETVERDFLKLGFKILEGYGLTETSPVVTFNPFKRPKIGSVGRALPDVKLKIINKDAKGVGEIAIQGPNVMKGYYKDETKTKEAIKDGWFLSGDLGYIDRDGYLYITGRSKEIIVLSSGKNIYPEEIEKHYSSSPYVKEMCVMGLLKDKGGAKIEYLHAVIVPDLEFFKERGEMNVRKVLKNNLETLSKDMPLYKHIMGFTITQEALPRTVLGKIKRYEVERKFLPLILDEGREEKDLSPEEKDLSESDIAKKLISCIKNTLDIKTPVRLRDSIELDLGIDSLGRVELLCAIEKDFNIELDEEMIAGEIFTVKDILFKIEGALKKGRKKVETGEIHFGVKPVSWPDILRQPLSSEFQKKILLHPGWIDYILTFFVKLILRLFFRIFYNLKTEGLCSIPKEGPYILCVNHVSFLDGFIVAAGVPFRTELQLFFIGFRVYFIAPIVRSLVARARIIPIDATQIIEAMQVSYYVLKHKRGLCIFPEGERSIDGGVKEFKKGIGIIAKELNVPIVPVFIKGAFEAWPRTERLPRLHPIRIKFGEPVSPDTLLKEGMALGAKDDYEAISLGIREEMIGLGG